MQRMCVIATKLSILTDIAGRLQFLYLLKFISLEVVSRIYAPCSMKNKFNTISALFQNFYPKIKPHFWTFLNRLKNGAGCREIVSLAGNFVELSFWNVFFVYFDFNKISIIFTCFLLSSKLSSIHRGFQHL